MPTFILQQRSYTSRISLMSPSSRPGLIPWENILYASVKISTFPVRSPFPKSVPSTRSAPASSASSVACHTGSSVIMRMHTQDNIISVLEMFIHPLDLICVNIWCGHFNRCRQIEDDLVVIRVVPMCFCTALQISSANSISVPVKLSGEYSSVMLPSQFFIRSFTILVPSIAICLIASLSIWNHHSR